MNADDHVAVETADLVLQLGRAAYADCMAGGLTQAQWIALRFFARANRFSRTISGFAQFHATTRGTASQTVKTLVEKGYLKRTPSEKDARSVRFDPTPLAYGKLRSDPLEAVVRAAGRLTADERTSLTASLRVMLHDLHGDHQQAAVDICQLCACFERGADKQSSHCLVMQERLTDTEFQELCVRYKPGT